MRAVGPEKGSAAGSPGQRLCQRGHHAPTLDYRLQILDTSDTDTFLARRSISRDLSLTYLLCCGNLVVMGDVGCVQFLFELGLDSPVSVNGSTTGLLRPGPQLARRRCQCLAGPIRRRNSPSARAFLGLPIPNSVALVDHWHRPASGTRGFDSPDQPAWRIIHRHLSLAACVSVPLPRSHLSLRLPPDPSAQLTPNVTQPNLRTSFSLSRLTICQSSPSLLTFSLYKLHTLSPPNVSSNY